MRQIVCEMMVYVLHSYLLARIPITRQTVGDVCAAQISPNREDEEGKTGRFIGELFTKRRLPLPQTRIHSYQDARGKIIKYALLGG
jgi:hypothetical protein